jgi:hypothetical protein
MANVIETSAPQVDQPGPHQKRTPYQRRAQWTPIYGDYAERTGGGPERTTDEQGRKVEDQTTQNLAARGELHHSLLALPVGWRCPCGGVVHTAVGRICCPECGRIPRDTAPGKLDGSQRCTTGRQGRGWKKVGKGRA